MIEYTESHADQAVRETTGRKPTQIDRIVSGGNNLIFRVLPEGLPPIAVKYYIPDARNRIDREFRGLQFIRDRGFKNVPTPIARDIADRYAIYEFIDGAPKPGTDFTASNIDGFLELVDILHRVPPEDVTEHFDVAVAGAHTFGQYVQNITERTDQFEQDLASTELHKEVVRMERNLNVVSALRTSLFHALGDVDQNSLIAEPRLSPVDVGPHNILFSNGDQNTQTFIDFEYFGWDNPLKIIGEFLYTPASAHLAPDIKSYLVEKFISQSKLPTETIQQLPKVLEFAQLGWIATLLKGLNPDRMKRRLFVDPNFDQEKYITCEVEILSKRIEELHKAI